MELKGLLYRKLAPIIRDNLAKGNIEDKDCVRLLPVHFKLTKADMTKEKRKAIVSYMASEGHYVPANSAG